MTTSDRFTSYLLELDDDSFFSLFRNYLGPVETPYNKHELISSLHDFLVRSDTQNRIVSLLDETDRIVLSAVTLLNEPDEKRLARFLDGELDYAPLHDRILNLKDRLLLVHGTSPLTLAVNPLLQPRLDSAGLGAHTLIRGEVVPATERTTASGEPWLSTTYAAAMYPVLRDAGDLFTRSGAVRKRSAADLETRFGSLLAGEPGALRLRTTILALETLGLVHRNEDHLELRPESWEELANLPDRWTRVLLWSAILTSTVERAFSYAALLLGLLPQVPLDRRFTLGEILRMLQLTGEGMSLPMDRDTVFRLVDIEVFLQDEEDRFRLNPLAPQLLEEDFTVTGSARVQANMEVSLTPGVSFADALAVARITELTRFDVIPTFTLTDAAVAAAYREGIENPAARLSRAAGELPQNVRFLLQRWEDRAGAVRLLRGLILMANDEETAILESSPEFGELLREQLAPGVFLMSDDPRPVERLLDRLGLGGATAVEGSRPVDVDVPDYDRFLRRHRPATQNSPKALAAPNTDQAAGTPPSEPSNTHEDDTPLEDHRRELHQFLATQNLPEDVRQELSLRIDRKLVLFPQQLRDDVVPQYGTEARGLDYLGKIRLIEQAITQGDMLEIVTRSSGGSPHRVMVQPREVVESGNDLMLRARQEPDQKPIRIRIRKISLVRRLSGTLLRRSR